jgi:hypothetical protein
VNRPESREVGWALESTRVGDLVAALVCVRRLNAFHARERQSARRAREELRSQLRLPFVDVRAVEGERGGHTPWVLPRPGTPTGATRRSECLGRNSWMFPHRTA